MTGQSKKYPWYKRNPQKALVGKQGLTLEQRGAYDTILDLLYWKNDLLPDDDSFILSWLGRCNMRRWKRIKAELIACGRICVKDGFIRDEAASLEIVSRKDSPKIPQTLSKDSPNLQHEMSYNNGLSAQHMEPQESRIPEYKNPNINPNPLSAARGDGGIFKNMGGNRIDAYLTDATRQKAKEYAPRHDLHPIIMRYGEWIAGSNCKRPPTDERSLQAHFLSFVQNHVKKNPV